VASVLAQEPPPLRSCPLLATAVGSHSPLATGAVILREHEVHVWLVDLDLPPLSLQPYARTQRQPTRRSAAARAALMRILGLYTGIPAGEIVLQYGENGKPFLQAGEGEMRLEFNLSHSENLALYAFCRGRRLGVDIERTRDIADLASLSRAFLNGEERTLVDAYPAAHRSRLLYRYWTCKEALVKATGGTLDDMPRIALSLGPRAPGGWMRVKSGIPSQVWALREISPAPGYAAALAVEGAPAALRLWTRLPTI
jgi:4'-phosphopantetheinyl transferase